MDVPRVTGAARWRQQWRTRSWWRHEQVSIAAAVATALTTRRNVVGGSQWQQGGGGVGDARSPTGTEHSTSGDAAGSPDGARAAVGRRSLVLQSCGGSVSGVLARPVVASPRLSHGPLPRGGGGGVGTFTATRERGAGMLVT